MSRLTKAPRLARSDALRRYELAQFGAFTWAQAVEAGYPESTLSRYAADGTIHKIHSPVYTRQGGPLGLDTRRAAALLATGEVSSLVRRSVLEIFDCSRFRATQVQVGVARHPRQQLDGVATYVCHAARHGHVVVHAGHRVTSFPWTISDLGDEMEPEQIAHVIHQGRLRMRFELHELDEVLQLRGPFRGCANVRRALEMYRAGSAGTRSSYEDAVYGWVKSLVRGAPFPNTFVKAGADEFEVDIPFVALKLCIEVDGPMHDEPAQQEKDRVRDAALRAAGYRVERFHWHDIMYRPAQCRARLRVLLGV